jgi:hypothetical protein
MSSAMLLACLTSSAMLLACLTSSAMLLACLTSSAMLLACMTSSAMLLACSAHRFVRRREIDQDMAQIYIRVTRNAKIRKSLRRGGIRLLNHRRRWPRRARLLIARAAGSTYRLLPVRDCCRESKRFFALATRRGSLKISSANDFLRWLFVRRPDKYS